MSIVPPTLDVMTVESSALTQEANKVSVKLRQGVRDSSSLVWQQIDDIMRTSLERSGFRQPDEFLQREYYSAPSRMGVVVVAPGIMMRADEHEQRYGGIDLEDFRCRMTPDMFKAFVRHIGSIPGRPGLDINEIATMPY